MEVKGKVAIVTGASSGIGMETAKLLAEKGAKVALVARSKEKLQELSKMLKDSLVVVADMTEENDIKSMIKKVFDHYGRIDVLINNAGQGYDSFVERIDLAKYRALFDLDVAGPLIALEQVVPVMKKQKAGVIINVSSGTSLMNIPNIAAYSSLKRALNGLMLTAREELKGSNIIVCVVYPYITDTPFHKNVIGGPRKGVPTGGPGAPKADTPEHVAIKIIEAIETGKAEVFAHDFIGK